MAYDRILAPIRLAGVEVKNRVVRAAHGTTIGAQEPGGIGPKLIGYHRARARGGVGLSILEICSVHTSCFAPLRVYDPGLPDGYKRLMDAVSPYGMRVMQQLWHAGHSARTLDGSPPWGPSDIANPLIGLVPIAMSRSQIQELIDGYVTGARIASGCGLDGVEIHAAHSYLPQQFLSPVLNRRDDEYGGSFENRARFLMQVLRAVRGELGGQRILSVRLSPDGMARGFDAADNRRLLTMIEAEGLIDFVNLSKGGYFDMPSMIATMSEPTGYMLPTDAEMTAGSSLPRLITGRYRTLEEADQAIRLGDGEMVSMVRATIADPNLVAKTIAGREADVRPCIACNQACVGNINRGGLGGLIPMSCAVNPTTSGEATLSDDEVNLSETSRKVVVVGGGPAGLEAARLAALRGHRVILFEAGKHLGGQLTLARQAPHRHTIGDIIDWQERQVFKRGVDVRLNSYVDAEDVLAEAPDAVIIATGSLPRMDGVHLQDPSLPIDGIGQAHVLSSHDVMTGAARPITGRCFLIYDDVGHYEAVAVADTLIDGGAAQVVLVTRLHSMTPHLDPIFSGEPAKKRLFGTGRFRVLTNSVVRRIGNGHAEVAVMFGSLCETIEADYVVLISLNRCNREVYDALRGRVADLRIVGDASTPRFLEAAIAEGNIAGRAV